MWTREQLQKQVLKLHTTDYNWERLVGPMKTMVKAAVLIPLVIDNGVIKVWLTQRSDQVSMHKGQVSFPGGKKDPCDADAVDTAVREAHEEIGLEPSQVEVIGELLPLISIHQIVITPIVGIVSTDFIPKPNSEVTLAFQVPLDRFLTDNDHWTTVYESGTVKEYIHFFRDTVSEESVVTFGLTALFAIELACGIFEKSPEFPVSLNGEITPEDPLRLVRNSLNVTKNILTSNSSKL